MHVLLVLASSKMIREIGIYPDEMVEQKSCPMIALVLIDISIKMLKCEHGLREDILSSLCFWSLFHDHQPFFMIS